MLELWQRFERLAAWWYHHRTDRDHLAALGIDQDDWMSEAYITLTEAAEKYRPDGNFAALYCFYLKNLYRRLSSSQTETLSLDDPIGDDITLGDVIRDDRDELTELIDQDEQNELTRVLTEALGDLPVDDADVIRRLYYQEQSKTDVSAATGLSMGKVTDAKTRSLHALRNDARVLRYVEENTPWLTARGVHSIENLVCIRETLSWKAAKELYENL